MKNRKMEKALEKITQELIEMDITDLKKELNRQTDSDVFHLLKESGFSSAKELEIEALAEAASYKGILDIHEAYEPFEIPVAGNYITFEYSKVFIDSVIDYNLQAYDIIENPYVDLKYLFDFEDVENNSFYCIEDNSAEILVEQNSNKKSDNIIKMEHESEWMTMAA